LVKFSKQTIKKTALHNRAPFFLLLKIKLGCPWQQLFLYPVKIPLAPFAKGGRFT